MSARRFDWVVTALGAWLVGGFFIDLWAHHHGQAETFFTPWHGILYSGALTLTLFLAFTAALEMRRGASWRTAVPPGYELSLAAMGLFLVAGALDMLWHLAFGIEFGIDALFSPTHLLLFLSGIVALSGPLRAAWRRGAAERGWRSQGPAVLSVVFALSALTAMTEFVHPVETPWAERLPDREASGPPNDIYRVATDGSASTRAIRAEDGDLWLPALSPDGSRIAFTVEKSRGAFSIWVSRPDGSERRLLAENAIHPDWSPDGSRIAFHSDREQRGEWEVYVVGADGTGLVRLTTSAGADWGAAWSPDARRIAFVSSRGGTLGIHVMNADGSDPRALSGGVASWEPEWSPDGARIAFTADRDGDTDIFVMGADGSDVRKLTENTVADVLPRWSPDGSLIAYASRSSGDWDVFAMRPDGSESRNVTENPALEEGWSGLSWAPDGKSLIFVANGRIGFRAEPFVREAIGVAGVLVQSLLLAVATLALLTLSPPFGAFALVLGLNVGLMSVLEDQYRFIPAAVLAGLLVDLLILRLRGAALSAPRRADVLAAATPGLFFLLYFATLLLTGGIGWSVHLATGSVVLAALIGLAASAVARAISRAGLAPAARAFALPEREPATTASGRR